ncbi:7811_t:CDS:2 [Entrophospora sp. SA101]|nr:8797_t:CDS:2 [Entrophospora sp. SA101]CAJ0761314.1 7811_t:CDS:2 [Entrophospora sp. SA101]
MKVKKNRKCAFISALAFVDPQKKIEKTFVSSAKGVVSQKIMGENSFGFDPIFYFPQLKKTYAQLTLQECEENKIIFVGIPGSGKSATVKELAKSLNIKHFFVEPEEEK